jgi:hypothetical protein
MGQHSDDSEAAQPDGEQDGPLSVPDDRLPDDLQPTDDNPLAQPAGDDVPDDALIEGAGHAGSGGGSEDASRGNDDEATSSSQEASSETEPGDDTGDED